MNLYLYTVDEWETTGESHEFGSVTEYEEALDTTKNVENNGWQTLSASRLYLVETDGEVDLEYDEPPPNIIDRVLLWQWRRK